MTNAVPSMSQFITPEINTAAKSLKDIGDIDKMVAVCDSLDETYVITDSDFMPMFQTNYTNQPAHSVIPQLLEAELKYMRACTDYFHADPTLEYGNGLIWVHPRSHRFNVLKNVVGLLEIERTSKDKTYQDGIADMILSTYTDTEIFDQLYADQWKEFMQEHADKLQALTLPFKSDAFPQYSAGDMVTLYHGVEYIGDDYSGHAWTLCAKTAIKFAKRWAKEDEDRPVYCVHMNYEDVCERAMFYTNRREEEEVFFYDMPEDYLIYSVSNLIKQEEAAGRISS